MTSSLLLGAVLIGLLAGSFFLWAQLLRIGLRWAKVPDVTRRRIVSTTFAVFALQLTLVSLFSRATPFTYQQLVFVTVIQLIAQLLATCYLIGRVFKTKFSRAVQAWLPTVLTPVIPVAVVVLVIRPYLFAAFVTPGNSMAPTLLGEHWRAICPECGQPNYCSPIDEEFLRFGPQQMICDRFHVTESSDIESHVLAGDRFAVAKFLPPRRWDLVVFQNPHDPSTMYVKRLVGLPGETIHIEDGALWVDGERQTPPDSIDEIKYLSSLPDWDGPELWGSLDAPAELAADEYFVLGDFSAQSNDSRLWERGAPGHSSFAVPRSHLEGVVTHTFWPPNRWRIHR